MRVTVNSLFQPAVPDMTNEDDDIDPETQDLLTSDFEIGHYIRERIIPRQG